MWTAKVWSQEETREKGSRGSADWDLRAERHRLIRKYPLSAPIYLQPLLTLLYKTSTGLRMENPDLDKPQSSGEDLENGTCPPDDVREVYRQVLDPLSKYLMHKTTRFYFFTLEWRNTHSLRYAS